MIEYHEDASIRLKGSFEEGLKTGEWFYQMGDYFYKGNYIDDLMHGLWEEHYNDKRIKFSGEYALGIPIGKHKYYHDNGKVHKEGEYEGGLKDVVCKYYTKQG